MPTFSDIEELEEYTRYEKVHSAERRPLDVLVVASSTVPRVREIMILRVVDVAVDSGKIDMRTKMESNYMKEDNEGAVNRGLVKLTDITIRWTEKALGKGSELLVMPLKIKKAAASSDISSPLGEFHKEDEMGKRNFFIWSLTI